MSNSMTMKVKIKSKFTNPLSLRREAIGTEMNVPKNQFWFKRMQDNDCELIKKFSKSVKSAEVKKESKSKSKGSK